jgi:hypothetical protein
MSVIYLGSIHYNILDSDPSRSGFWYKAAEYTTTALGPIIVISITP